MTCGEPPPETPFTALSDPGRAREGIVLPVLRKILRDYGMVLVLLGLCILFSILTLNEHMAEGADAAGPVAERIADEFQNDDIILVAGMPNTGSKPFAESLHETLGGQGFGEVRLAIGTPRDIRVALDAIRDSGGDLAALATCGSLAKTRLIEQIPKRYPTFSRFRTVTPRSHVWPDFLKRQNLLVIVNRIVVIAVIAIGMSMVIITGGIDLSVGSLVALSAVICTLMMKKMGGAGASGWVVFICFLAGILSCGIVGGLGGYIVSRFKVAPFITTLAVMMMARGLAFMVTGGFSIYQVPKGLTWLGLGRTFWVPNTVLLLVILYAMAHVFMSHTAMGRYVYAVGGNEEAARLSGVPVRFVIISVYVTSALAAGLGGCILASQLNVGVPSMGKMYELYVIAAVVVGGTSLSGGSGKMLGTLIGAFIIAVIQNGMNLLGIESYAQAFVLGAVILGAVLLDKVRAGESLVALADKMFGPYLRKRRSAQ
jgi:ribose transport system permease protein